MRNISAPSFGRGWMSASLLFSDLAAFMLAGFLAIVVRRAVRGDWSLSLVWQALPVAAFCLLVYALRGLYPAVGLSPVGELRRLSATTSVVVLSLAALTFFARNPEDYSRLNLGLTWVFSLVSVPLGRAFTRSLCARLGCWGEPVAVIGYGEQGYRLVQLLKRNRRIGWYPLVVFDGFGEDVPQGCDVPVLPASLILSEGGGAVLQSINTVILLTAEAPGDFLDEFIRNSDRGFRRLILIPDLEAVSSLGVTALDVGGVLGLEIRNNLLDKSAQMIKRLIDVALVLAGGLCIAPFLLLFALVIRLDSAGGLFYGHTRIGKDERKFRMWKFRTMVQNADQVLAHYLAKHPKLRAEWESNHKLKDDLRITRVGKILRRLSLDELPQLWNVLKGEMSLVGPRPIVEEEAQKYAECYAFYKQVKPGITGLWQVSGRNDTTYEERVRLDEHYVCNWSIWLDIYILARTFWVVIRREGAY